jgi:hypothetical protein
MHTSASSMSCIQSRVAAIFRHRVQRNGQMAWRPHPQQQSCCVFRLLGGRVAGVGPEGCACGSFGGDRAVSVSGVERGTGEKVYVLVMSG